MSKTGLRPIAPTVVHTPSVEDEQSRFKVVTVSGYSGSGGMAGKFRTLWYVLDTAVCYRIVWAQRIGLTKPEVKARREAARLNAEYQ